VEYRKYDLLPVMNKIGGMLVHPVIRLALIENTEEVSLRKAMDEKKIVLVNLSKGHFGADVANILGALFVTSIASAAFSRVDTVEEKRVPFMVYMDEFHNFTTLSLVNMLSELRKFVSLRQTTSCLRVKVISTPTFSYQLYDPKYPLTIRMG
jgi:hypothetical protein